MFPIVIQEQITEKELTALNRIVLGSRRVFNTVFYAVLLVILIGLQILLFAVTGQIRAMIAVFTAVLLLIFLYWLVGVPLIIGNLVKKQIRRNGVEQTTIAFYETYLVVNAVSRVSSGGGTFSHNALIRAEESEEYFFLFPTNVTAYIIDKKRITAEQATVIRDTLFLTLGKRRYKVI